MRSVVAIVETRPETVLADYGRVMGLAGLAAGVQGRPIALLPTAQRLRWFPGSGTPPWQLAGVLSTLQAWRQDDPQLPAVSEALALAIVGHKTQGGNLQENWGWRRVLAGFEVEWAADAMLRQVAYRAQQPLPALAAVVPSGFGLPSCLIGRRPVLLPVPAWKADWPLAGAVALLERLLAPQQRKRGKIPRSEVLAEIVTLAREALGDMLVVMDAVTWLIPTGPGGGRPVVRNLLLAGMDPVAVDAVAMRLAGGQPESIPWFRLCQERGVGAVSPDRIRLVGRSPAAVLDAEELGRSVAAGRSWPVCSGIARRLWETTVGRTMVTRHRQGPWGRLYEDFRRGNPVKEQA